MLLSFFSLFTISVCVLIEEKCRCQTLSLSLLWFLVIFRCRTFSFPIESICTFVFSRMAFLKIISTVLLIQSTSSIRNRLSFIIRLIRLKSWSIDKRSVLFYDPITHPRTRFYDRSIQWWWWCSSLYSKVFFTLIFFSFTGREETLDGTCSSSLVNLFDLWSSIDRSRLNIFCLSSSIQCDR